MLVAIAALSLSGCPKPAPSPDRPQSGERPRARRPTPAGLTAAQATRIIRGWFGRLVRQDRRPQDLAKLFGRRIRKLPTACRAKAVVQLIPSPAVMADPKDKPTRELPALILLVEPPDFNACRGKSPYKHACVISAIRAPAGGTDRVVLQAAELKTEAAGKPLSSVLGHVKTFAGCHFVLIKSAGDPDCEREHGRDKTHEQDRIEIFRLVDGLVTRQSVFTLKDSQSTDRFTDRKTGELKWTEAGSPAQHLLIYTSEHLQTHSVPPSGKPTGSLTHGLDVFRITRRCELDPLDEQALRKLRSLDRDQVILKKRPDGQIGDSSEDGP